MWGIWCLLSAVQLLRRLCTVFKHAWLECGVQTACAHFLASLVVPSSKQQPRKNYFLKPGYSPSFPTSINGMHSQCNHNCLYFSLSVENAKRNHIGSANKLSFDFASSPNNGHECNLLLVLFLCRVCMCVRVLSPGGWKCQPVLNVLKLWWCRASIVRTSRNCVFI